ncbi:unnamed protein product [Dimorphilus gyrociliatus]|uniref:J domain-containing protein n=1 Tax=Dimorphilus gyrociliatus TaxID=2664684 RepID=A0A7I8VXK0_9ANNE|nr:unnamed protein product [Dimorphilus gyrociliatus]
MEEILGYEKDINKDYYTILGCCEKSSIEQICSEYKARALRCHPDKCNNCPEKEKEFQLLQMAKSVLTDPVKRKDYDCWRNSGLAICYKDWVAKRESIQTSMHWVSKKTNQTPMIHHPSSNVEEDTTNFCSNRTENPMLAKFRNYKI